MTTPICIPLQLPAKTYKFHTKNDIRHVKVCVAEWVKRLPLTIKQYRTAFKRYYYGPIDTLQQWQIEAEQGGFNTKLERDKYSSDFGSLYIWTTSKVEPS